MNTRVQSYIKEQQRAIDCLIDGESKMRPFLEHKESADYQMAVDTVDLFHRLSVLRAKELELVSATWNYFLAKIPVVDEFRKVIGAVRKWDKAAKDTSGQGISAFLDAAEPLGVELAHSIVEVQTKRKEQIESKSHIRPTVEAFYALRQEILDFNTFAQERLKSSKDNNEQMLKFIQQSHGRALKDIEKWIQAIELEDREENGMTGLDKFIQRYSDRIDVMFAEFDKLAQLEAVAEAEQQAALGTFASSTQEACIEGQSYLAAIASSSSAMPDPEATPVKAPVFEFPSVSDSPSSSPSGTPPKADRSLISATTSSDDESPVHSSPSSSPKNGAELTPDKKQQPARSFSLQSTTAQLQTELAVTVDGRSVVQPATVASTSSSAASAFLAAGQSSPLVAVSSFKPKAVPGTDTSAVSGVRPAVTPEIQVATIPGVQRATAVAK